MNCFCCLRVPGLTEARETQTDSQNTASETQISRIWWTPPMADGPFCHITIKRGTAILKHVGYDLQTLRSNDFKLPRLDTCKLLISLRHEKAVFSISGLDRDVCLSFALSHSFITSFSRDCKRPFDCLKLHLLPDDAHSLSRVCALGQPPFSKVLIVR